MKKQQKNPQNPISDRRQQFLGLHPISGYAPKILRSIPGIDPQLAELTLHWAELIGENLAKFTKPQGLLKREAHKILDLRVSSGAVALEIQHETPQMIEKINGFFGFGLITGIKISQGPL